MKYTSKHIKMKCHRHNLFVYKKDINGRARYILRSGKLADCQFLVGTTPNISLIAGHRTMLAMASPEFERMFYGSFPEVEDPIRISDVQPNAFKVMLNYIYTDEITISTFDNAWELYFVAKKFMLPHLVSQCINFMLADLKPKNASRTYEYAKFYDETRLIEKCLELIGNKTQGAEAGSSFKDIEASTLMANLDQKCLNIDSELNLFNPLLKSAYNRGILNDEGKDNTTDVGSDMEIIELELENLRLAGTPSSAGTSGNVPNVAH